MINTVDISTGDFDAHVDQALQWIRSGLIIAAPLENGYAFLCDAFDHDAVRAMHVIRGDALGVASQVLISGLDVLDGIAREVSIDARALMTAFWPGQLTFNLKPQRGLTWDLGDSKRLDLISVRAPSAKFVHALLRKSGPLAVASAAKAGKPPIGSTADITAREYDVAGIFEEGTIPPSPSSTIVSDSEIGVVIVRQGALTLEQLQAHAPDIKVSGSTTGQTRE